MATARFPRTFLALLIQAAFLAVPATFAFVLFTFYIVVYLGWFWLLFGASLPMYLTAKLFKDALQLKPMEESTDSDK
jgi:hypothetical protein